jgi:hypothetical protein
MSYAETISMSRVPGLPFPILHVTSAAKPRLNRDFSGLRITAHRGQLVLMDMRSAGVMRPIAQAAQAAPVAQPA